MSIMIQNDCHRLKNHVHTFHHQAEEENQSFMKQNILQPFPIILQNNTQLSYSKYLSLK